MATTQRLIAQLLEETGATDPDAAIRSKAQDALHRYRAVFDHMTLPVNAEAIASFLGIGFSTDAPLVSQDAELVPTGNGTVAIRINPDRPETRKRFSVAHEISHTFFPNYHMKTWCRADHRYRSRDDLDGLIETLCDVGAAELIMPTAVFAPAAATIDTAERLVGLAQMFGVSREAAMRRYAETHARGVAAVFFTWKLKPTQRATARSELQPQLEGMDPVRSERLRVSYSIRSAQFENLGIFIPPDKSIQDDGPIYDAASTGLPQQGICNLDLGRAGGLYGVLAIPVWTPSAELGPKGEQSVAAIVEPIKLQAPRRKVSEPSRRLLD